MTAGGKNAFNSSHRYQPFTSYLILGKLLNLFKPRFSHLLKRNSNNEYLHLNH